MSVIEGSSTIDNSQIVVSTGWININTGCNNRCVWCYRQGDLEIIPVSMPFNMAQQIVDFFVGLDIYSCIFIGGEPTLYSGLSDLVKYAKTNNIKEVTVVTNGRVLKDLSRVNELINSELDVFSISIHSAFAEVHDDIARTPSWAETVAGIKNVIAGGAKKCSLNIVAGEKNIEDIPKSLPIFLEWGIDEVIVSCAIPCINQGEFDGSNALDPRRFAELIENIKDISDKILILHELPLCLILRDTFLELAKKNRLGYGCHIGVGRGLSIDVNGQAIPCNSFPHLSILDLFEDGKLKYSPDEFLQIWQNDESINSLRKEANVYRSKICLECDLWQLCNCGCPLTWGYFEPQEFINNGLLGIDAQTIQLWTVKKLNP